MKYGKQIGTMVCLVLMILCLPGCSNSKKRVPITESASGTVVYEKGADFVGVIKTVDAKNSRLTFYNATFEEEESYSYSGATEIYSKYSRDMSMEEVEIGDVFDVYTSKDGRTIEKLQEAANIVETEGVKVSIDSGLKRLTIRDTTYAYTDRMVVYSDGQMLDPMEITSNDEVTFRGIKGQAYSLVVTKGHGYIRPSRYNDFVGGTLTIQGEAILPITKGMLLTVPEGTQTITMTNGDLTGTASVVVKRNQVTDLNMAEFQAQVPDTARVTFRIEPEGAELYVNGSLTDYAKPVSLKYGKHSVRVILEGYNEYRGILTIKDPAPTVDINLQEEQAEVDDGDDTNSDSKVTNDTSGNNNSAVADYDTDHKITVSAPSGAAVYINGTYKGKIPCSFMKMLGSITLTLTQDGYTTKSYSIEIPDDSQDISWSFPKLQAKSAG